MWATATEQQFKARTGIGLKTHHVQVLSGKWETLYLFLSRGVMLGGVSRIAKLGETTSYVRGI